MDYNVVQYKRKTIMAMLQDHHFSKEIADAILNGDRVEIVPTKDGAKLLRVHKKEIE